MDTNKPEVDASPTDHVSRRDFVQRAAAGAAAISLGTYRPLFAATDDRDRVLAQVAVQHDTTVKMLQEWIALPSIAAEGRNYPQGPEYMARLARDAGFDHVEIVPTAGKSGVFALDHDGKELWHADVGSKLNGWGSAASPILAFTTNHILQPTGYSRMR